MLLNPLGLVRLLHLLVPILYLVARPSGADCLLAQRARAARLKLALVQDRGLQLLHRLWSHLSHRGLYCPEVLIKQRLVARLMHDQAHTTLPVGGMCTAAAAAGLQA